MRLIIFLWNDYGGQGLRISEMAAPKIKDIDLKRGYLSVIRLKRKKRKKETLALGKDIALHLKEYI